MEKNDKKLEELIGNLAVSVANGFEKINHDLASFKLETNINFSNLETDLKSFKKDTRENFDDLNEKVDNISDTIKNYDKRIEILETI